MDGDADGHGDMTDAGTPYCEAPSDSWITDATDCDDTRADVHPGAPEVCDADDTDEDCDGTADDDDADGAAGKVTAYIDADADGFGDQADPGTAVCDVPSTHVLIGTDCDDGRADVHPGHGDL